jgi:hypothetical protein
MRRRHGPACAAAICSQVIVSSPGFAPGTSAAMPGIAGSPAPTAHAVPVALQIVRIAVPGGPVDGKRARAKIIDRPRNVRRTATTSGRARREAPACATIRKQLSSLRERPSPCGQPF